MAWLDDLKRIVEDSKNIDWHRHTEVLNRRLGLVDHAAMSPSVVPLKLPFWFNGDVSALVPGRWALVFSLNHQLNDEKHVYPPAEGVWDYFRNFNASNYYPRFFRPLVRVASAALDEVAAAEDERSFATKQMVFVELCPYASRSFALSPEQVHALQEDPGFQTAWRINDLLITQAHPGIVLVNGTRAIETFERLYANRLSWKLQTYPSSHLATKTLWHKEGYLATIDGDVPVAGFPFLRTRSTHNANVEVADLGTRLGAHTKRSV